MAAAADLARGGGQVILPVGPVGLAGTLAVPGGARALVVFAHGAGAAASAPASGAWPPGCGRPSSAP